MLNQQTMEPLEGVASEAMLPLHMTGMLSHVQATCKEAPSIPPRSPRNEISNARVSATLQ